MKMVLMGATLMLVWRFFSPWNLDHELKTLGDAFLITHRITISVRPPIKGGHLPLVLLTSACSVSKRVPFRYLDSGNPENKKPASP